MHVPKNTGQAPVTLQWKNIPLGKHKAKNKSGTRICHGWSHSCIHEKYKHMLQWKSAYVRARPILVVAGQAPITLEWKNTPGKAEAKPKVVRAYVIAEVVPPSAKAYRRGFSYSFFFSRPSHLVPSHYSRPPAHNSDPGSHGRPSFLLPTTAVRTFIFYREKNSAFSYNTSSTRVELRVPTLPGALSN